MSASGQHQCTAFLELKQPLLILSSLYDGYKDSFLSTCLRTGFPPFAIFGPALAQYLLMLHRLVRSMLSGYKQYATHFAIF